MRALVLASGTLLGVLFLCTASTAEAASVLPEREPELESYVPLGTDRDYDIPAKYRPVQYDLMTAEPADQIFFPETLPKRLVETGGRPLSPGQWPAWIGVPGWYY